MNHSEVFIRPLHISTSEVNACIRYNARQAHVSAGVVVRHQGRVLIVRKVKNPNHGRWSIPAGHCEWGESPLQAAHRELREETGIEATGLRMIYSGEVDEGGPCRYGVAVYIWFLYLYETVERPSVVLETAELDDCRWVQKAELSGITKKTPAFDILLSRVAFI